MYDYYIHCIVPLRQQMILYSDNSFVTSMNFIDTRTCLQEQDLYFLKPTIPQVPLLSSIFQSIFFFLAFKTKDYMILIFFFDQ